jgi:autotransporter-associated beta strand protein
MAGWPAHAGQIIYWTGDNGHNWDTGSANSNWSTSMHINFEYGQRPQNDVIVNFNDLFSPSPGGATSVLNFAGLTLWGLESTTTAACVLSGQTFTLSGDVIWNNGQISNNVILTRDSTWSGSPAAGLTMNGAISGAHYLNIRGNVTLGGTNTFTGGLLVGPQVSETLNGTGGGENNLHLSASGVIPDACNVTLRAGFSFNSPYPPITYDTTLYLDNHDEDIGSLVGSEGTFVQLGSGTLGIVGSTNGSFGGVISGTGSLVKQGTGRQELLGANTYSGGTTLTAGTLYFEYASNLGAPTGGLALNGGTLEAGNSTTYSGAVMLGGGLIQTSSASVTLQLAGTLVGTGDLRFDGPGTLSLTGSNLSSGKNVVYGGGTLALGSAAPLGYSPGTAVTNQIQLDAGTLKATASFSIGATRGVTLNAGGGTFETLSGVTLTGNSPITGAGKLTKTGAGTLSLTGTNTYLGGTLVSQGTLQGNTASIKGAVQMQEGTSLVFNQTTDGTFSNSLTGEGLVEKTGAGTLILNGQINNLTGTLVIHQGAVEVSSFTELPGGVSGAVELKGGTLRATASIISSVTNGLTLGSSGGTLEVANGATLSWPTVVGGSGGFTKSGSGTLALTGTNTYGGSATISAGTLRGTTDSIVGNVANSGTLEFDQTNSGTFSSNLSGAGVLIKNGVGTVTLNGTNTATGKTTINGGALRIDSPGRLGTAPGSYTADYLTLNGGTLANSATAGWNSNRGVTLGAAGGTIEVESGVDVDLTPIVTGAGTLTKTGTGTLHLTGANSFLGSITVGGGILQGTTISLNNDIANAATVEFTQNTDGTFANALAGSGQLLKSGSGSVTLSGTNTYTGKTTILAGKFRISSDAKLGPAPNTVVTDQLTLDGGTLNNTASFSLAANRGVQLGTSGGTFEVDGSQTLFAFGVIGGSGDLSKAGLGVLDVRGANTYTGDTLVTAGTLTLGGSNRLPNGTTVNVSSGATLNLGAYSETIAALEGAGSVALAGGTFTIGDGLSKTFSGAISGSGNLIKSGSGKQAFSGVNTYNGTIGISGGILTVSGGSAIPNASALTLANVAGAALELQANEEIGSLAGGGATGGNVTLGSFTLILGGNDGDTIFDGVISGSGGIAKTGGGTFVVTADNSYTGKTTVTSGTLSISKDTNLGQAPSSAVADQLTLNGGTLRGTSTFSLGANRGISLGAGNGTIYMDATKTLTVMGAISGTGGLIKEGSGTLTLSGSAGYSGTTTVSEGMLRLGASERLLDATALSVSPGATFYLANNNETVGSLAGAGTVTLGSGTLTVGGTTTSTFSGALGGSGGLTKNNTGLLTLSGTNNYTGTTNITGGTLAVSGGSAIGDGVAVVLTNAGSTQLQLLSSEEIGSLSGGGASGGDVWLGANTLTVGSNNQNTTFTGWIVNTGSLVKVGTGTLTLLGTGNSYSGGTTVSGGTLKGNAVSLKGSILNNSSVEFEQTVDGSYAGAMSGSGTLVKSGSSVLQLTGNNAFTGATTISQGTLRIGRVGGALPDTTPVSIASGATLDLAGQNESIAGLSGSGNVTLNNGTLSVIGSGSTTFSGVISSPGLLTKSGSGTLDLTGANSFAAATVTGGTLKGTSGSLGGGITNSATVEFAQNVDGTYAGLITGTGSLVKSGSGTVTLTSTNNDFQAGVTVNGGTLRMGSLSALPNDRTATVNNGTLDLNGYSRTLDLSLTGGAVQTGAGTLTVSSGNVGTLASATASTISGKLALGSSNKIFTVADGAATDDLAISAEISAGGGGLVKEGTGTLVLSGTNTYNGPTIINAGTLRTDTAATLSALSAVSVTSGILNLNGYSQTINSLTLTGGTVQTAAGTLTLGSNLTTNAAAVQATITGNLNIGSFGLTFTVADGAAATDLNIPANVSGSGGIIKSGAGILALGGNNTVTGGLTINGGTVRADSGTFLPSSANIGVGAGALLDLNGNPYTVDVLTLTGGSVQTGAGILTVAGRIDTVASATQAGISGKLAWAGSSRTFTVADGAAAVDLAISAVISSTGGGLTKAGAGSLVLNGVNTYSGPTQINAGGLLRTGVSGALPTGTNVSILYNTLDLNGTNQTIGTLTLGESSVTTGTGVLTLGGNLTSNAYANSSTISGKLNLGGATRTFTVGNGTASEDLTIPAVIFGTGGILADSGGTLVLQGANTFTGNLACLWGVLKAGSDGNLGDSSNRLSLAQGATLQVTGTAYTNTARGMTMSTGGGKLDIADAGNTFTASAVIDGTGSLTKTGLGTLVLSASNTYAGATTVTVGTLRVGAPSGLPANTDVTLSAGTTLDINGFSTVIDQLGGAGNVLLGTATLTTGGTNGTSTHTGTITGSGGLTKTGSGTLTLSGTAPNTFTDTTTVDGGTLVLQKSGVNALSRYVTVNAGTLSTNDYSQLPSNTVLTLNGGTFDMADYSSTAQSVQVNGSVTINGSGGAELTGPVTGGNASVLTCSGDFGIGNTASFAGFRTAGVLDVAASDTTLNSRGFASLGILTTLNGGTLRAPNGILVGPGMNLLGHGNVEAKVSAGFGATIEADGSLALGSNSATDGFFSDGTLSVGHYTVTLNDSNAAVLGSQTTLGDATGGGTLTGTHGLALEMGKNLTGYGIVNGAFLTDGYVKGEGPAAEDCIRFNGAVTGFGDFAGKVTFAASYLPGHSPDAVNFQNITLADTNTLFMELGGTTPDTQHDQLLVSGTATLGGILNVSLINSFQPTAGNLFNLFDWGGLTGVFDTLELPSLTSGLLWDTSGLYTTGTLAVETAPPPPPANLTATLQPGLAVRLQWQDTSPPATGFEIQRALDAGFTSGLHEFTLPAGQTSCDDADLTPQATFHYRICVLGSPTFSTPAQATTPSRLADWRWVHFGNQNPVGDGEDLKDVDHDGVVNLVEYCCNLDPKLPDARTLAADGTSGLPAVSLAPDGRLRVTFLRRTAASLPSVSQGVVFSNDLVGWNPDPAATTSMTPIDSLWERVVLTDSTAPAARRYARTVVEVP